MAVELETVHWVDSVFEEGGNGVPHYNYQIQSRSRDTLGSSNLEVFVEEDHDGLSERVTGASSGLSSASLPTPKEEVVADGPISRGGSTGSTSSIGFKYSCAPPRKSALQCLAWRR